MDTSLNQQSWGSTQMRRPKIRRAWSAPSHRQAPPSQPLKVSGFRLHRDMESEFQRELGKNLFEKSVELQVTQTITNLSCNKKLDVTDFCCWRQCHPTPQFNDPRRCVNIRDTQCKSPLVTDDKNFVTYFKGGRLDVVSVARSRGVVDLPAPNIGKYVQRVRNANMESLESLSMKDLYYDGSVDYLRGSYWRGKVLEREEEQRLDVVRGFCRDILDELLQGPVSDGVFIMERRRHLLKVKQALDEQTQDWFDLVKEEAQKEAVEREAARKLLEINAKKSKRRKSKRNNKPRSILKGRRSRSKSDTDSDGASMRSSKGGKSVRFREQLTDTRIIRPKSSGKKRSKKGAGDISAASPSAGSNKGETKSGGRILSPNRKAGKKAKNFPGSTSSEKVTKKKKKKKFRNVDVSPVNVNEIIPEVIKKEEDEVKDEVKDPDEHPSTESDVVVILEEPPNFSLADEYRTKKEMVAEWLQNKHIASAPKTLPLF